MSRRHPKPAVPPAKPAMRINPGALMGMDSDKPFFEVRPPDLMPGVMPAADKLAMDSAPSSVALYQYANLAFCGLGFPGYPFLSELAQRPEYRSPCETIATEATRKWIKITSQGDGDLSDKIEKIEAAFRTHGVREIMRDAALHDQQFGRAQIYINIDNVKGPQRATPLVLSKQTIRPGSLKGFKNIEPIWTGPLTYNSIDATAPDFYRPQAWYILGVQTHATRLLTMVSRPVPDMLKPAYNFSGVSLQQLMIPYVDNWIRTRDSVSDAIHNFSITVLHTDMGAILQGGGSAQTLLDRAKLFNQIRDNRGLMIVSRGDEEDLTQVNMPLSGLDKLQAQAQEQMAAICHLPLVKLLGITPSGLNASAEPELDCFYEFIHSYQENVFTAPLNIILKVIQLDMFGEIDDSIGFEYEPLKQMNGTELAAIRKSDADAGVAYIAAGVIGPDEERARLATDPDSGYTMINAEDLPEQPGAGQPGELDE